MISLEKLLRQAVETGASDLHIQENSRPALRIQGKIHFLDTDPLDEEGVANMILPIMSEEEYQVYVTMGDVDFAYNLPGLSRFRVNALNHYNGRGAVFRVIPNEVPTLSNLGLPPVLKTIAESTKGLVLITGPTGCGKSTTMAAMLNHINVTRTEHIITVEDPIEFIHPIGKSYLEQRELGRHAGNFADALKASLRESPDVLMVGEMRDLDTISQALRAAETGHLVLATLHTSSVSQTLARIVDVFPPEEQAQIRSLLSGSLRAVICQQLLPRCGGGRVAAMEIMIMNSSMSGIIREGKTSQIRSFLMMGRSEGMQTLDLHLAYLLHNRMISMNIAEEYCTDMEILKYHDQLFDN
ncbi:MAG: type IV pilus twitching motility protein PilT [Candidatus Bruticola sp.]